MMRIIFTNQKGGVGKTTLTREIGICLSHLGQKVLLVDCDPQGNLSKSLGIEDEKGLLEALEGEGVSLHPLSSTLAILPGTLSLSLLESRLLGQVDGYQRMKDLFEGQEFSGFDFILLDTPPSLGVLTLNALAASHHVIIPMIPSLYSMQGTNDLMATMAKVKKSLNPQINLLGVIVNAFDPVPLITREIREEIKGAFGEKVFSCGLSKSIRIEEAIATGEGIIQQTGREFARSRDEVLALTNELMDRVGAAHGEG